MATGHGKLPVPLDENGFLQDFDDWTPAIATAIAAEESITLTEAHQEIISLVQRYFREFGTSPGSKLLVRYARKQLGDSKGNSIYLMQLFGGKAARTASRIAGLPKPDHCL